MYVHLFCIYPFKYILTCVGICSVVVVLSRYPPPPSFVSLGSPLIYNSVECDNDKGVYIGTTRD